MKSFVTRPLTFTSTKAEDMLHFVEHQFHLLKERVD